jgi:hypothetical protein
MPTNQAIVDRAGQELGYIGKGDALDATDAADALADLNSMMAEWRENGKDLNWFSQDDLTETCPIPDWAERGVISNLAVSLGALFDVMPSQQLMLKADRASDSISRVVFNLNLKQADMTHMPQGRAKGRNILTDA